MTGLAFSVFGLASVLVRIAAPGTDATATSVELYVVRHYHSAQVSIVLSAVALLLFALFSGHLSARIRRADASTGDSWAPCFLIGAAGLVVLDLAAVAAQGAYQELSHLGAYPTEIADVYHVDNGLAAASGILLAVMLVSVGMSGLLNGTVPVPLSWLALVTALIALVGAGGMGTSRSTFGTLGVISQILWMLWSLGVSLWLLLGTDAGAVAMSTDTTAGGGA